MNIGPARPASTVVLLKTSRQRFDVCLVRRHDEVAFMGGAYVFPGGRVDDADRLASPDASCDGAAEAVQRMTDLTPAEAIGHHVAAIRELFEEAGVLLARRDGRMLSLRESSDAARFREHRAALVGGSTTLGEIAAREQLRLALDALVLMAHWVTPEIEIRRFDARFFVAAAPSDQTPLHDDRETTESVWLDPAEAIDRCRRDELMLPPPTWTTLRLLERFTSVDEVVRWCRGREVVRMQPMLFTHEGRRTITLPGDTLYTSPPDAVHVAQDFEQPRETRFVFGNGRWKAVEEQ